MSDNRLGQSTSVGERLALGAASRMPRRSFIVRAGSTVTAIGLGLGSRLAPAAFGDPTLSGAGLLSEAVQPLTACSIDPGNTCTDAFCPNFAGCRCYKVTVAAGSPFRVCPGDASPIFTLPYGTPLRVQVTTSGTEWTPDQYGRRWGSQSYNSTTTSGWADVADLTQVADGDCSSIG
jgi:hypothetical protein